MAEKSLGRLEVNNELVVFSPLRSRREDPVHQPAPDAAAPHKKNVVVWPPLPSPLLLLALPPCSPAAVVAADWLRAGSCSAGFFLPFSVFSFFLSSPQRSGFHFAPVSASHSPAIFTLYLLFNKSLFLLHAEESILVSEL